MTRHFVIGTEANGEQNRALRNYFNEHGTWWNWIPGFWLFVTDEDLTVARLRDRVKRITAETNPDVMVLEVTPVTWAGYGPGDKDRDMFKWLRNNWGSPR